MTELTDLFKSEYYVDICPGVELLYHIVALISFLSNLYTILLSGFTKYIPTSSVGGFPLLHIQHLSFVDFLMMAFLTSVG